MAAHITRPSVLTGETMYYAGNLQWTDSFEDRKVYSSRAKATSRIEPTTRLIGGSELSNANGAFKNATIVTE